MTDNNELPPLLEIKELLRIHDSCNGDWCRIARVVEQLTREDCAAIAQRQGEPVADGGFLRGWLNLKSLPGGMMHSGQIGKFGPVPASCSAWVTTSEKEARSWGSECLEVWLAAAPATAERQGEPVSDALICEVFMRNGFTIKEGQTDLKPYVYAAARALLAATAEQPAVLAALLDAVDELEASARGDEPFNHYAGPLLKRFIEGLAATAPAPVAPTKEWCMKMARLEIESGDDQEAGIGTPTPATPVAPDVERKWEGYEDNLLADSLGSSRPSEPAAPVAEVLTDAQLWRLWDNSPGIRKDAPSVTAFLRTARAIIAAMSLAQAQQRGRELAAGIAKCVERGDEAIAKEIAAMSAAPPADLGEKS